MLRAGRALILLKGLRPSDGYQHKTVVEFTSCLLGEKFNTVVGCFDKMRKKRNIFTYEVDISISRTESNNALHIAGKFVIDWFHGSGSHSLRVARLEARKL